MKLVVLVEEPSMAEVLRVIMPQIVPQGHTFKVVKFNGRGDLERGITRKLRGWNEPDVKFVILEDQDCEDCLERKERLKGLVEASGKDALIRIVCHELEAWYFGDLEAVAKAYGRPEIVARCGRKKRYRDPDDIEDAKEAFRRVVPDHQQVSGAKLIAPHMRINGNTSRSFQIFVSGVSSLCS